MTLSPYRDYRVEEIAFETPERRLHGILVAPPAGKLAPDPALVLAFSADRAYGLCMAPAYIAMNLLLLERGHRLLTLDLPQHGERADGYGEGLAGLCNAFAAGQDPFAAFLGDAAAVIQQCQERGLARAGGFLTLGISRGAYFALRLLAAEEQVRAAAALAPVTDWRDLSEFATLKGSPRLAGLALPRFAARMAGKPAYIAIGHRDARVNTWSCVRFALSLADAHAAAGFDPALLDFCITEDEGHSLGIAGYVAAGRFLAEAWAREISKRPLGSQKTLRVFK